MSEGSELYATLKTWHLSRQIYVNSKHMTTIISIIGKALSSAITQIVLNVLQVLKETLKYLNGKRQDKKDKNEKKEREEFERKVDDVVDNGNIEDLLEIKR